MNRWAIFNRPLKRGLKDATFRAKLLEGYSGFKTD
jgi:hypothetical protein